MGFTDVSRRRRPWGTAVAIVAIALAGACSSGVAQVAPEPVTTIETSPSTSTSSTTMTPTTRPTPSTTSTALASVAVADGVSRPDQRLTPGAVFPGATAEQVCVVGYTKTVRSVSRTMRQEVFARYGVDFALSSSYELDHLIPLELGGSNAVENLWPQPLAQPQGAYLKDRLENYLHTQVCAGRTTLPAAQAAIATDWYAQSVASGHP